MLERQLSLHTSLVAVIGYNTCDHTIFFSTMMSLPWNYLFHNVPMQYNYHGSAGMPGTQTTFVFLRDGSQVCPYYISKKHDFILHHSHEMVQTEISQQAVEN